MHVVNESVEEKFRVRYAQFYSEAADLINDVDLRILYVRWRDAIRQDNHAVRKGPICALFEHPFLLSAKVKRRIMQIEELESMTKHSLGERQFDDACSNAFV